MRQFSETSDPMGQFFEKKKYLDMVYGSVFTEFQVFIIFVWSTSSGRGQKQKYRHIYLVLSFCMSPAQGYLTQKTCAPDILTAKTLGIEQVRANMGITTVLARHVNFILSLFKS